MDMVVLARRLRETGDKGLGSRIIDETDDNGAGRLSLVDSLARVMGVHPGYPRGLIKTSPLAGMGSHGDWVTPI